MSSRQRIALIGALVSLDVLFTVAVLYGWSWVSASAIAEILLGSPPPVSSAGAEFFTVDPAMRILPLELIALVEIALIAGFAFWRHWRAVALILLSGPALATLLWAGLMLGRAIPGRLGYFAPLAIFSREFDRVDPMWTAIVAWGPPLVATAVIVAAGLIRPRVRRRAQ